MTTDPILDELHAVRERMLADAGGTLAGLAAKIEADQAKSGRVILKNADNHRMHRSGACTTSQVENQTSPPGDA
ncbi:MAG: hypothetical protein WBD31_02130 [Rubripirellula sp.]